MTTSSSRSGSTSPSTDWSAFTRAPDATTAAGKEPVVDPSHLTDAPTPARVEPPIKRSTTDVKGRKRLEVDGHGWKPGPKLVDIRPAGSPGDRRRRGRVRGPGPDARRIHRGVRRLRD